MTCADHAMPDRAVHRTPYLMEKSWEEDLAAKVGGCYEGGGGVTLTEGALM